MSKILKKATKHQEANADKIPKTQRPDFHVSCPIGWMNDPNGWSVYQGEYHLFFQYFPYDTHSGNMHWGHIKTKDFINWERMPVALAPDMKFDNKGCFSGSAIENNGKHILMYTGVFDEKKNHIKERYQVQCIAIGDGIKYKKIKSNPVITARNLPQGCHNHDFRDPKIWKKEGQFYAVVGSKSEDNNGQVVIFRSLDLKKWEFVNILNHSQYQYGEMWECPDLFELQGKDILITSPQFMEAKELEFHNGNTTMCIVGKMNQKFELIKSNIHAVDYGLDFYAPQTLEAPDGRRIMIGWMQSWDNYFTPEEFKWSGIMSFPRVLTLKNNRLCQYPVKEIEAYRNNKFCKQLTIHHGESYIDFIKGRQIDIILKLRKMLCSCFFIKLACGEDKYTQIKYEPMKEIITFDRTYSGLHKDVKTVRKMKIDPFHEEMEIRILMDKYTIEIFVDEGKYAMSSLIYTSLDFENIDFATDGQVDLVIEKYDICV